jgi:hypothetical protein
MIPRSRVDIFSIPQPPDRLWGPPSLLFTGYWCSFPGVKRPVLEADHSPASTVEIKSSGAILPLPHTFSRYGASLNN